MEEDKQAITELEALAKVPGALMIITSEIVPQFRRSKDDPSSAPKEGAALAVATTFVQHAVTRLEVIEHRGTIRAYSDEGDWTEGRPVALLRRLREHRGG